MAKVQTGPSCFFPVRGRARASLLFETGPCSRVCPAVGHASPERAQRSVGPVPRPCTSLGLVKGFEQCPSKSVRSAFSDPAFLSHPTMEPHFSHPGNVVGPSSGSTSSPLCFLKPLLAYPNPAVWTWAFTTSSLHAILVGVFRNLPVQ